MKRISLILSVILFSVIGCQKDLVQIPQTTKTADNFYSNETELEEAVKGVYATLQFTGNYNTAMPAIGELPGEDAYDETPANDNGYYGQLDDINVISQNGIIQDNWADSYTGIQRANIVLNRIKDITYKDNNLKNARIGEMKFIRALYYFNLVRIYGDVPLVTTEISNPLASFGQTRAAKIDVYKQIEADLNEAILLLPIRTVANKMRVVKTAAQTLLGKVKLTQKDYASAETLLLAVENSGVHQLLADVTTVFPVANELNDEIIFSVQFASGLNSNSKGSDAYRMFNPTGRVVGSMTGTKGHGVLKSSFYNLYDATDKRKNVYVGAIASGIGYNNKIAVPATVVTDAASDWVVLRYADVILMLAEIENELAKPTQALSYLNMIRTRAGLSSFSSSDKTEIFNEIDLQRRKELVWEGHRWFDLLRQDRVQTVLGVSDVNKLLMPLPASQIATDPSLKQNPGY
ncbi:MAG: RagB/SusD family nutrient uptake outer membrane protein [Chitinophagaceae bacterium]|nr:RagB/SusD family nutrient uptake outer membrane protein [Chitinophagaceae bacterium]